MEKFPLVANPFIPKNSILSMMAFAGTVTKLWSVLIFLLVAVNVLTRDTDPVAFLGVKHWMLNCLLSDALVGDFLMVHAPPEQLGFSHAAIYAAPLFVMMHEFIPKDDEVEYIFFRKCII
jgi:predicted Co/Zn/Cd cation transporter (cation efflux family)